MKKSYFNTSIFFSLKLYFLWRRLNLYACIFIYDESWTIINFIVNHIYFSVLDAVFSFLIFKIFKSTLHCYNLYIKHILNAKKDDQSFFKPCIENQQTFKRRTLMEHKVIPCHFWVKIKGCQMFKMAYS